MKNDDFGDRMKLYEGKESNRTFLPLLPICIRLDGRGFSKFTKGLQRPYDSRMIDIMIQVTRFLVEETSACIGYTQSDEISLILYSDNYKSQTFFDGRIQKLVSVLAALATAKFNQLIPTIITEKTGRLAVFDCRAWQTPNQIEAVNTILWREKDATKNSISMASQHYYSHKALLNKTSKQKQEMLFEKGVNWNDYPDAFKKGSYLQRKTVCRKYSVEEFEKLPPKHRALQDPDLLIERSKVELIELPPLSSIKNKIDVIFNGADFEIVE
jgi:tRNA(His) 5'-end guanylyltransferase